MQYGGILAAVATLAIAGAGGCGGSNAPLTSAQLTQRADAICRQRDAQGFALRRAHGPRDLRGLAAAALPLATRAVHDLHGLKPLASTKALYGRFLDAEDFYLAQLKRTAAGQGAGENVPHTHELMRASEQLGLTDC